MEEEGGQDMERWELEAETTDSRDELRAGR